MERTKLHNSVKYLILAVGLASGCASMGATVLPSTTLPVRFTKTLDAAKAKPGDMVTAQTLQAVVLPDGAKLVRGALVVGHVAEVHSYVEDQTPNARPAPSVLAIHFDRAIDNGVSLPLNVSLRAFADKVTSDKALAPSYGFDDNVGTMVLVGGEHWNPGSAVGFSPDHDAVLSVRKDGVYARLIPNDYIHDDVTLHCDGTKDQQPVGIFSANACGYFGYSGIYIESNGSADNGTIRLESNHGQVKIYPGSTALLETR